MAGRSVTAQREEVILRLPGSPSGGLEDLDRALAAVDPDPVAGTDAPRRVLRADHRGDPELAADSAEAVERYKVEPYAACADVYSAAPHIGRGGWTWYTGSAAWLYRAGLEAVLGFQFRGNRLLIDPCIPKSWSGFQITYQRRRPQHAVTRYVITVENPDHVCHGVTLVERDGKAIAATDAIALADDGQTHTLRVMLGQT